MKLALVVAIGMISWWGGALWVHGLHVLSVALAVPVGILMAFFRPIPKELQ